MTNVMKKRSQDHLVQRTIDVYGLTAADRHSKYAGIGFDVSIIETFPPLCCGGELHIVPDEYRLALPELAAWLDRSGITVMDLPTQKLSNELVPGQRVHIGWDPKHLVPLHGEPA